jgi:hypothetical protein
VLRRRVAFHEKALGFRAQLGVPMRAKKSSLTAMLAAVLSSGAVFAETQSDAPPGYFWRDNIRCQDLSFEGVTTETLNALGRQIVRGVVVHTGRDPVKGVQVCGGGVCEVVADGAILRKGQRAQFLLEVPSTGPISMSTECSVLQKK